MTAALRRDSLSRAAAGLRGLAGERADRYGRLQGAAPTPISFEALHALPAWCRLGPADFAAFVHLVGFILLAPALLSTMDGVALRTASAGLPDHLVQSALDAAEMTGTCDALAADGMTATQLGQAAIRAASHEPPELAALLSKRFAQAAPLDSLGAAAAAIALALDLWGRP